jgi:hypothetical protein
MMKLFLPALPKHISQIFISHLQRLPTPWTLIWPQFVTIWRCPWEWNTIICDRSRTRWQKFKNPHVCKWRNRYCRSRRTIKHLIFISLLQGINRRYSMNINIQPYQPSHEKKLMNLRNIGSLTENYAHCIA